MNRTLRGIRARAGSLLALSAMTAVVVAGTVVVLAFARTAGTSWSLVVPLLVLGLVAVPAAGRELAAARRDEIGVARLRGLTGHDLVRVVLAEPLSALVVGAVVGLGAGVLGARLVTGWWLDEPAWPGWSPVVAALGVAAVGVLAVYLGMRRTVVEPLPDQLASGERSRESTVWAIFGALLMLVGAAVALYRSGVAADDPDVLTLAGPALVGLACGQVALWVIAGLSRVLVRRTAGGSMASYLAVRRLRRAADVAAPLRLLVAATVIATLALAGGAAVRTWTDQTARLDTLGGSRVEMDVGASAALALTDRLDPEGRHLMAAVGVREAGSPAGRRVFVDVERWLAVAGDSLESTPAASLDTTSARLLADRPGDARGQAAVGRDLTVSLSSIPRALVSRGVMVDVELTYLQQDGYLSSRAVRLRGTEAGGPVSSRTVRLPDCGGGCWPTQLAVSGVSVYRFRDPNTGRMQRNEFTGEPVGPFLITDLTLGDQDLLEQEWTPTQGKATYGPAGIGVRRTPRGGQLALVPSAVDATLPVVTTPGLTRPDGAAQIGTPGGLTRPAETVATVDALPLLGSVGQLADLRAALVGDGPTIPAGDVYVLAAPDTPDDMLAAVAEAGGHPAESLAQRRNAVERTSGAEQAPVFTLMALGCLAVAIVLLWSASARQSRMRQVEVAALRVVGVRHDDIARAARLELVVLTAVAVVLGVAGGLLATAVLLGNLPILRLDEAALPLRAGVDPLAILGAGGVCALALLVVGWRTRSASAERSSPASLRETTR